jgi:hypothetical protein
MAASFAGPSAGIGSGEGNGRRSSEVLAMVAESLSLHRARALPPSLPSPTQTARSTVRRSTRPTAVPTVRASLPAANCTANGVRPPSCGSARPTARLLLTALPLRHLADRRARGTEAATARATGRAGWAKWVGPVTWQWSLYLLFSSPFPFALSHLPF